MTWWIMGGVILCFIALYLFVVWLEARQEVRSTPRVDMATCDKHGIYPAKYALQTQLLPLGEAAEGYKVCPVCLADAERRARTNVGLKN